MGEEEEEGNFENYCSHSYIHGKAEKVLFEREMPGFGNCRFESTVHIYIYNMACQNNARDGDDVDVCLQ